MSISALSGQVIVTFFDIRAAERAVSIHSSSGGTAEFQAQAQDLRSVAIARMSLAPSGDEVSAFQAFGEVVRVSTQGEDIIIDFYDMRAAQQASVCVPGCRLHPCSVPSSAASSPVTSARLSPALSPVGCRSLGKLTALSLEEAIPASPGATSTRTGSGYDFLAGSPSFTQSSFDDSRTSSPVKKPVREKVNAKDLTKFEIMPETITSGQDSRTTVMIRNIPKACPRDTFVQLLGHAGLGDRYTFFYMPFDKRRNVHCGFAFLNFMEPHDVLKLYLSMSTPLWRNIDPAGGHGPTVLAISYARLQGQDALMKHFSLSAVMYDHDARKRPFFNHGKDISSGGNVVTESQSQAVMIPGLVEHSNAFQNILKTAECPSPTERLGSHSTPVSRKGGNSPKKSQASVPDALALQPQYIPLPISTEPTSTLQELGLGGSSCLGVAM
jgi:hypothetical protein